jgi:hypothetical protein
MRRFGVIAATVVGFALVFGVAGPPAQAGTCILPTCTFELTNSNVTQLDGAIDVRVTWDNTGPTTTLSVQWISGGPNTPTFISEFGYNSSVAVTDISGGGNFADWTATSNAQIDGFGKFATDLQRPNANQGNFGITSPIVFTLASLITSIPDNANGAEFAVHVGGYSGGCSGFVSDGTASSTSSNTSCGAVSEPAVLLLTGVGFAGAGYLARRRSWFSRLAS